MFFPYGQFMTKTESGSSFLDLKGHFPTLIMLCTVHMRKIGKFCTKRNWITYLVFPNFDGFQNTKAEKGCVSWVNITSTTSKHVRIFIVITKTLSFWFETVNTTVNLIGYRITMEKNLWACLWGIVQIRLAEAGRPTLNVSSTIPSKGLWSLIVQGEH